MKLILAILATLFLTACGETPSPQATNALSDDGVLGSTVIKHNFELAHQTVTVVPFKETIQWLKDNKHIYVHSIAPIDRTGHGLTSGYIIVWSTPITH